MTHWTPVYKIRKKKKNRRCSLRRNSKFVSEARIHHQIFVLQANTELCVCMRECALVSALVQSYISLVRYEKDELTGCQLRLRKIITFLTPSITEYKGGRECNNHAFLYMNDNKQIKHNMYVYCSHKCIQSEKF